jgi:hypothetical protein
VRWLSLVAGAALMALAFAAATRVTDTREGLIAEVILLFAALAGIGLLVYGLTARRGLSAAPGPPVRALDAAPPLTRSRRDLLTGAGGVALGAVLLAGLALSGGILWLALGFALLLPMLAGSVYLFVRFLRSASR